MIQNPILKGFNPDPSIIRIGSDYYIATSTFEWFPGVQIHHSKDLVNWELLARPLKRKSQLDLIGVPDSGGVWAPCLSYDKGTFYLVYSNVHSFDGVWKDTPNYLVTTKDIRGDWSEPIFLNSSGFDGSLFHDNDGRKYYLSMLVDHRRGTFFGGIIIQEFDSATFKLVGSPHLIFQGTELGLTEGPHLYKKGGYYYLILAEGGTEYGHAVSMARSKNIMGPYELHPNNPILSARDFPDAPLQKTGHADLVATEQGQWYIVCLAARPLTQRGRCILGRETVIEEIVWKEDDWPYLKNGTCLIRKNIPIHSATKISKQLQVEEENFSDPELSIHFQSLRRTITEDWCSLKARPNYLRLYGQESLSSLHRQSLLARRVQAFHIKASTCVDFQATSFQQLAGLICYYNSYHWHYLHLMGGKDGKRYLQIISCDKYDMQDVLPQAIELPKEGSIYLQVIWNQADIYFFYALQEGEWTRIDKRLDGSILSDDYVRDEQNRYRPAFTGAFVGICCQDLSGNKLHADFAYWKYEEIEN